MGFADALSVMDGSDPQPSPPVPGRAPLQVYIGKAASGQPVIPPTDQGGFGGALGILSGTDTPPPNPSRPKNEKDAGALRSFFTGVKSGLTANFSDELSGAVAAGKTLLPDIINPDKPGSLNDDLSPLGYVLSAAGGAGRLGYEAITGSGEGTAAYEKARDAERERQRLATEQHPVANIAGNIAGALALPVGGAVGGATLAARAARGAAVGAGYGAAYGAGEGESASDRATRAGAGALFGGVAGGVAPPILAGVSAAASAVGRGAGRVLGHPIETARGIINPDQEASRRIGTNIIADIESGRPGMSAADLAAARSSGQPTAVIDVGGENTRALGRSAANTSPAARAALDDMSGERFARQSERVANFVRDLVPTPGNATRTAEAIDVAERAANSAGYKAAYAANNRNINSSEITRLMESPDVQSAVKGVEKSGKSRAVADKTAFDPSKRNLQFWDYVYRDLREAGTKQVREGGGTTVANIAKQLRTELDLLAPEYAKTRGVAAQFFQAENALEAGQKFVSMRGPIEEARVAHAKMTPAQKVLFAEGYVSDLADKVAKISDNRSLTIDRIFNSPDGRARTELALGAGRAKELELFLRRENMMDLARKALGNSTTARQLMEMGIAGGVGAMAGGAAEAAVSGKMPDMKTAMSALLVGGAAGLGRKVNFKVAQRVGEMLASDDPKVLMTAIKMAKTNPDAGRAIRSAETVIEKIMGQRSNEAAPLLPNISAGRAEDQQQR